MSMHVFIQFYSHVGELMELEGFIPTWDMDAMAKDIRQNGFTYYNDDGEEVFISPAKIKRLKYREGRTRVVYEMDEV